MSKDVTKAAPLAGRRRRFSQLSKRDKITLGAMVGLPTILHVVFVWIPTIATIVLSFTKWDGLSPVSKIKPIGFKNYYEIFTVFEQKLFAALFNNVVLLVFLFLGPSLLGVLLAYLLDKNIRGTRIYQSIYYFPVVLSLAVVGIIWKSVMFSERQGLLNHQWSILGGRTVIGQTKPIDFIGDHTKVFSFHIPWLDSALGPSKNFLAILVAIAWRHAGYVMVLYLAGLKSVDPALREAAAIDGCTEVQAFRNVVFPAMKPINVVVMVITVIEALRTFDIVAALRNPVGMELISLQVTENIVGEGGGQVGRGSAYGVILLIMCIGFIIWYLVNHYREEQL
jgi:multiple sugar transport system permease protein